MPGKLKFKWTKNDQDSSNEIKRIVSHNTLVNYPDFIEEFKIYINASDFQLGEIIIQKGKTIAVHSIKLTEYQRRYTVTERELLRIVENIKEFWTTLLGKRLIIYTNN